MCDLLTEREYERHYCVVKRDGQKRPARRVLHRYIPQDPLLRQDHLLHNYNIQYPQLATTGPAQTNYCTMCK